MNDKLFKFASSAVMLATATWAFLVIAILVIPFISIALIFFL